MHIVYVLRSKKDKKLYIGCTQNIEHRLDAHNKGGVASTKHRRPFELIYSEQFIDKYEAYRTERFYKTAKGKRVLKKKINE